MTKYFLIFIIDEEKNFAANNNHSSCWNQSCTKIYAKKLVTDQRFVHQMKEDYYKIKFNWVLKQKFNLSWYFEIGQGSGKIPHTCNRLIIDQQILWSNDFKFTRWGFCLPKIFPIRQQITVFI